MLPENPCIKLDLFIVAPHVTITGQDAMLPHIYRAGKAGTMALKGIIMADSCCDIQTLGTSENVDFIRVPLTLQVDNKDFVDDDALSIAELIQSIKVSEKPSATACPSPEKFAEIFRKYDVSFVVTLSSRLSGTYNSAMLAKAMVEEEEPQRRIHVVDSKSASAGEVKLVLRLKELMEADDASFEGVVAEIERIRNSLATYFVLQSFDSLVKAGRMGKIAGFIASKLSICPLCGDDGDGQIKVHDTVRTPRRAIRRMAEKLEERVNLEGETLVICHCNNLELAEMLRTYAMELYKLKEVIICATRGISSFYAGDKGVVAAI